MNGSLSHCFLAIRVSFTGLMLSLMAMPSSAASPADAADKAAVLGQPTVLQVQPQAVTLHGRHANQQLIVTGRYADGLIRDLTGLCTLSSEAADVAAVDETGFVTPKKNGQTAIVVKAGEQDGARPRRR